MENYILEWKIVQFLTHIASFLSEWPFAFLLVIACKPWELFSGKNVYSIDQQKKKIVLKVLLFLFLFILVRWSFFR